MYDVFYKVPQPSLKDLQLHYMDTDSFLISFTVKFKHELGSRLI